MRRWYHVHNDTRQEVEVLGWTQHGAIVLAIESGWLPQDQPVFVRIAELESERFHEQWIVVSHDEPRRKS